MKRRLMMVSMVIGLAVGVGIAFLREILDSTITSEKDVGDILQLPVMGVVGSISLDQEKKSSLKSHRVRGK